MTESQNATSSRCFINRTPHSVGALTVKLQKTQKQVRRTPRRPTHTAASAEKPRKVTRENQNSSLVVPDVPNPSTDPDVKRKFFAPENQGVTKDQ